MSEMIKKRTEIAQEHKWKLEDMYPQEEIWEEEFNKLKDLSGQIETYRGRLGQSAQELLSGLRISEEAERLSEKLYAYARMRRDENNADTHYQTLVDRIETLGIQVASATAFITPELTGIPKEKVQSFMENQADLKVYQHFFAQLWRQQDHILSPEEERLLAMSQDLSSASGNIFGMLNNADIKFPVIKDENGQEIELTKGRFGRFMESQDRRVRQEAFSGLYSSYGKLKNTLAATLSSSVKKDIFYARARKYPSALIASLDQDNISPEVYDSLIKTVHEKMDYMYRYMKLRQKMLQVDELHMYDIYVPLVKDYQKEIPYEEACSMVFDGLKILGEEYLQRLRSGINGGWIDIYENEGKTSGAYSWGTYDSHPYVLLNYDNKLDDVFTLAHELGHSLHSLYSHQAQPYVYSQYPIFLAEVASTVNESLLIDHLLQQNLEREEKIYLLNHYLEQFRATVYRQTMFAEFEKIIHEKVEAGEALTADSLCSIYRGLNELYYGSGVVLDQEIELEWARIPHFYSAFYVYKYATGFAAATALKEQILYEGEPAVKRYIKFLQSGNSDYPLILLKQAGVDLSTSGPVASALDYFGKLLTELESLV
ncbi:oligoendopeptidase F [Syntrophomonas palmitatica]|uniref:oligoendopeptidase F n=1 Tax=Syntrophomonas palmitatica TaxID=402877 RepID=UPI0006D192D3|nr:oligoendopeptidase F [Syntrophomonas palmitatica]